jgi:hypothetical protein
MAYSGPPAPPPPPMMGPPPVGQPAPRPPRPATVTGAVAAMLLVLLPASNAYFKPKPPGQLY